MRAWHQQTLATVLIALMLAVSAKSVELFRYRYNGEDGAEYEAVFETDEQSVGKTVDKEKAEEIAMAWMQVFYGQSTLPENHTLGLTSMLLGKRHCSRI